MSYKLFYGSRYITVRYQKKEDKSNTITLFDIKNKTEMLKSMIELVDELNRLDKKIESLQSDLITAQSVMLFDR